MKKLFLLFFLAFTFVSCRVSQVPMGHSTRMPNTTFSLWLPDTIASQEMRWRSSNRLASVNNGQVSLGGFSCPIGSDRVVTNVRVSARAGRTEYFWVFELDHASCNPRGAVRNLGTISFRTSTVWTVGNQEWSDVVVASNCSSRNAFSRDRGVFVGEQAFWHGRADCRSNSVFGDLFSFCAVIQFQDQLCPEGWRVPTQQDFIDLDRALGGGGQNRQNATTIINTRYLNRGFWGGAFGGHYFFYGGLSGQQENASYWSQTVQDPHFGRCLYFNRSGVINPQRFCGAGDGHTLRCVRTR